VDANEYSCNFIAAAKIQLLNGVLFLTALPPLTSDACIKKILGFVLVAVYFFFFPLFSLVLELYPIHS